MTSEAGETLNADKPGRHDAPRHAGRLGFVERYLGWILAGVALVLAAVLSKPDFDSVDANVMGQVAEGLLHHGTPLVKLHLPARELVQFHLTGKYSNYGLGMSLLWVPVLALEQAMGLPHLRLVAFVAPVLLAVTVLVIFQLALSLGTSKLRAGLVTTAVAFGSFLLTYGTTYYSEPAVTLCVAVALLALVRRGQGLSWAAWLGAAAGLSVLFRTDSFLLVALPVALAMLASRPSIRQVAVAVITAAPSLIVWGWYNQARFGSLSAFGYSNSGQGFTHPFFNGFVGLLVSPGKGIIWFAPVLVLSLWGVKSAYRRWPMLTILAIVLIVSRILFYASWWAWDGGLSFGPRFLVPAIPALAIPLTALVVDHGRDVRYLRIGAVLVAVGAMVALLGAVSTDSWGTNAPAGSWRSNPVVIFLRAHD